MEEWNQDLETAASAVEQACRVAVRVQSRLATNETVIKEDRSPVTIADFAVQAVVSRHLATHLADLALVAEESASTLRTSDGAELLARVTEEVQCVTPDVQPTEILDAIDHGSHPGGASGRFWTLDPVDGTKGFLRGGQYAIALALIEDGQVVLGVLGCPNLAPGSTEAQPGEGALLTAVRGSGAHTIPLVGGPAEPIAVDEVNTPAEAVFCESVERAHSSHAAHARIAQELGVTSPPCRIDSQCKYAVLARGQASIYLRLPTRPGYEEKIWDHAAGSIVIEEAGGRVTDIAGAPLDFSLGHTLANNRGVIATNRRLHDRVLVAVATTLEP
jgi:3'(2'), 5'-bisphosphate nucleotidase